MTQAFNLSQFANKVNSSGLASLTTAVTGTLPIANGGTGAASLTGNSVAITNAGGTALSTVAAGTTGNVLTSNGTTWTSAAGSSYSGFTSEQYFAPATFTLPTGITKVRVTVVGAGGGGGGGCYDASGKPGGSGGGGGIVIATVTGLSGPVAITIGSAGNGGTQGASTGGSGTAAGTTSFGAFVSITGGAGGTGGTVPTPGTSGANGTATLSGATAISVFSSQWLSDGPNTASRVPGVGVVANVPSTGAGKPGGGGPGGGGSPSAPVRNGQGGTGGAILIEY